MAITAKQGSGDFELAPQGVYPARCYKVIDLGTQKTDWNGEVKMNRKVNLFWELLGDTRMADGKPFIVTKRLTLSLHKKSEMRPLLCAWRGRDFTPEEEQGFDVSKLLGAYCQINVIHEVGKNGSTYANVGSIMPLPKGMPKPDAVNKNVLFEIENPDMAVFESLSEKIKSAIQSSPEWADRHSIKGMKNDDPDADFNDLPF